MKLYTINATPVRASVPKDVNEARCEDYPAQVGLVLDKYGIDGFSIYEVQGYWKGEAERSFKIEIAVEEAKEIVIFKICNELRSLYNQDAVMLTNPDNSVEFI